MKVSNLWVERYRPTTIDEYVFKSPGLEKTVRSWIESGDIPHIGLFGPAGTGKTSLIEVLLNGLVEYGHVDRGDITIMNMSEKGIDAVRLEIDAVASMTAWGKYRVFVLEEMEAMSYKSQGAMKRIMEDYIDNARFILTSNAPHKIIAPLHSRIQEVYLDTHDKEKFNNKLVDILLAEKVQIETEEDRAKVQKIIDMYYPDFRKALNTLQLCFVDGQIVEEDQSNSSTAYRTEIIEALKAGTIRQMRDKIVKSITDEEIDDFFTFLYQNVDLFSTDDVTKMRIYICIRDGAVNNSLVADRELNLTAVLCEIDLIASGEL